MRILAIDTAAETLSTALLSDNTVLAEVFCNSGENHSLRLLTAIQHVYDLTGTSVLDTDLFVCTHGPGSFTGVRIAVSTIKGLAMAANKPVIGISSLEALAANFSLPSLNVCAMLDAQGGQIYAAAYQVAARHYPEPLLAEMLCDVELFLASLNSIEEPVFIGSGALRYAEFILRRIPRALILPKESSYIRAGRVGFLGLIKFNQGRTVDFLTFTPHYLRLSEAERKFEMPPLIANKSVDNLR